MIFVVGTIFVLFGLMVLSLLVGPWLGYIAYRRSQQGRVTAAWVYGTLAGVFLIIGGFLLVAFLLDYSENQTPPETLQPPDVPIMAPK